MGKYLFPITLLVLIFCITFPLYPIYNVSRFVTIPYVPITSVLLAILAGFLGIQLWIFKKHYFFVCGECDLTFLNEERLREHYAIEHLKKDSD